MACSKQMSNFPYDNLIPVPPRVQSFAQIIGMNVFQINSQRYFGPSFHVNPNWLPEPGSEIFVGRIPRCFQEPDLVPFLEQAGPFYQLRLMMNFSGTNKGFCFVKYFQSSQADLAVKMLHGQEFLDGFPVVASKSVDNRKLLLSGVPTWKTLEEIKAKMMRIGGEGLVTLIPNWTGPVFHPKGLVYVIYNTHRAAALARKRMMGNRLRLWGYPISVDWAEPEVWNRNDHLISPQILRIRYLTPATTQKTIWEIFDQESFDGVKSVKRFGSEAFVYFKTRGQAELAKVALNGAMMGSKRIRVEWAHPQAVLAKQAERDNVMKRTLDATLAADDATTTVQPEN